MRLQRMIFRNPSFVSGYDDEPEFFKHVCGVNEHQMGGEFTLCGCAIPDSSLDFEDWEAEGEEFNASEADNMIDKLIERFKKSESKFNYSVYDN